MNQHFIMGVHITDRLRDAVAVQKLLTEYGSHIKTRLGLHEIQPGSPSMRGLLLLECVGESTGFEALAAKLQAIEGVEVQTMVFSH